MIFSINDIVTITFTLFAIIDVIGSLPAIINVKSKISDFKPLSTTLFTGFLMIAFLLAGNTFLNLIGIDVSSFAVAGSIVIFIIGIEMILGINLFKTSPEAQKAGSLVPIGFPLLAGSGTLTSLISLRAIYSIYNILIGVAINLILIYIVLRSTGWIERKIGPAGLEVIKKFFGVILIAIAVKIFRTNLHV
ncbi:MAG TPA: MarC family protein [Chitinophagales bacterium]|nr:MarC family protein [Chitinophagales bacterium]